MAKRGWRRDILHAEKIRIKSELDQFARPKERLSHILNGLYDFAIRPKPTDRLIAYIYGTSALIHHLRHGGLSRAEIKHITRLVEATVRRDNIVSLDSRQNYLLRDLNILISQIHRYYGEQDSAVWVQLIAEHYDRRTTKEERGFQAFSLGMQMLRQASACLALNSFKQAIELGVISPYLERAHLIVVKCYRLMGQTGLAKEYLAKHEKVISEYKAVQSEWEFEKHWIAFQESGEALPLCLEIAKLTGDPEYIGTFAVEGYLLINSLSAETLSKRFYKPRRLHPVGKVDTRNLGILSDAVKLLQSLYDSKIGLEERMASIAEFMPRVGEFKTIDQELLFRAAITRWFVRKQVNSFAQYSYDQFARIGYQLTQGRSPDPFNLLTDLTASYREKEAA